MKYISLIALIGFISAQPEGGEELHDDLGVISSQSNDLPVCPRK
jgi:hypothetical protein